MFYIAVSGYRNSFQFRNAETLNLTALRWDQYRNRDSYQANVDYDQIALVCRYGWGFQGSGKYERMSDAEAEAQKRWDNEGGADLPWDNVRPAFRDSWERALQRQIPKLSTDRTS